MVFPITIAQGRSRMKTYRLSMMLAMLVFPTMKASAVPAAPIVMELAQPDGITFSAITYGDEWNSGTETVDGYTVVQDPSGVWYYAQASAEKLPGHSFASASTGLRIFRSTCAALRQ